MPAPITFSLSPTRGFPLIGQQHPLVNQAAFLLTDNFDDNSRGQAWTTGQMKSPTAVTTGVTVSETNSRLEITPANSSGSVAYSGYISTAAYDLRNSSAFARISFSGVVPSGMESFIGAGPSTSNGYLAIINDVGTILQLVKNGSASNVGSFVIDPATIGWLRLRSDTTNVYIDTASSAASDPPLASDWTNRVSVAADPAIELQRCLLSLNAGTASSVASPPTARFDGFNTATTGSTTTTVTVTVATMTYQGQAITVNAKKDVAVTFGTMTYTGQSTKTVQGHSVVAAVMTYAAQAITVNATKAVAVVNAVMTYAGQSIAVVQTSIHAISNSTMAYLGRDVTVNANFPPITWLRGLGLRLGERWKN